jgi:SOS-response transcriptional repressor LexA
MADSSFYSPSSTKEKYDERVVAMATPSMARAIDAEAAQNHETRSDVIRRALEQYYAPRDQHHEAASLDSFSAPYLSRVPCGPWSEAIDSGDNFLISADVADELEAQDGDVWVRADGQSMEGAGIQDGFVALVRPYDKKTPRRGEIVLIQVTTPEGDRVGTIKRFNGLEPDGKPRLLDGNDEPYSLPEPMQGFDVVGRVVGVLGRI